ncbi:MAG: hypothetical protein M1816_003038 [Peltula sp. TS41687]|nr:MAG: hypothetical protein M1816_003038 [Peltula sp. TS41687]
MRPRFRGRPETEEELAAYISKLNKQLEETRGPKVDDDIIRDLGVAFRTVWTPRRELRFEYLACVRELHLMIESYLEYMRRTAREEFGLPAEKDDANQEDKNKDSDQFKSQSANPVLPPSEDFSLLPPQYMPGDSNAVRRRHRQKYGKLEIEFDPSHREEVDKLEDLRVGRNAFQVKYGGPDKADLRKRLAAGIGPEAEVKEFRRLRKAFNAYQSVYDRTHRRIRDGEVDSDEGTSEKTEKDKVTGTGRPRWFRPAYERSKKTEKIKGQPGESIKPFSSQAKEQTPSAFNRLEASRLANSRPEERSRLVSFQAYLKRRKYFRSLGSTSKKPALQLEPESTT